MTIIFIKVKENDNIVNKNAAVAAILFQHSVYKTLYIQRKVHIVYEIDIETFYSSLVDKDKTVLIIGIYYKLEKEVRYIDNRKIFLFLNRIDNLLLQRQRITIWNCYSIKWLKICNNTSFFDVFHYISNNKDRENKEGSSIDISYTALLVKNIVFFIEYNFLFSF